MTDMALPLNHHYEVLQENSPAVWYERSCAVTGETLRAGAPVVVCDNAPGQDPISEEGWRTVNACPHCGQLARPAAVYVPPVWGGSVTPPIVSSPPTIPPPSPARGSPLLLGALAALLLLLAGAVAVAAFTFSRRTAERDPEPPTATVAVVQVTATPAAATAAPTAPAAPTATVEMLPSPTLALVKTAAPTPAPLPSPTPPSPATVAEPGITALSLVNPGAGYLFELRDGATVDLSEVGANYLTIVADVNGPVGSVTFFVDGERHCRGATCVENAPPYYMHGDASGDPYSDWDWSTMLGAHTISAVACTGPDATGRCYPALEIDLTVTP